MSHQRMYKDNEIGETINELRDIAITYHNTDQLRERIAQVVRPLLSKTYITEYELVEVEGNLLPPIGAKVQIHLGSIECWVEQTVVGYYVWKSLENDKYSHRVFIRVIDTDGTFNSRLLKDVRWPSKQENNNNY